MNKIFLLYGPLILCVTTMLTGNQEAVVVVPVADLVGQSMKSIDTNYTPSESYDQIPVATKKISMVCPRIHQLLFNEVVEIVRVLGDEVYVNISNTFYVIERSNKSQTTYCALKKNIITFDTLKTHGIATTHIPIPIDFQDNGHHALHDQNIVTLLSPFYDAKTKQTFSAGTRFVRARQQRHSLKRYIKAYVIDFANMKQYTVRIPRKICYLYDPHKKPQERLTDFVDVLRQWAHSTPGCIPYVWGGCSFTKTVHEMFEEIPCNKEKNSYYERKNNIQSPKTGFDCSGMIIRAAQLCGIPYFSKNTRTIAQGLPKLGNNDIISAGDLLVIRGHVMVIADVKKNTLIEARSYIHGYGKVQEIALNKVFQGIATYQDLLTAYRNKKPLKRLETQGNVRDRFDTFTLHRIMSLNGT